MQEYHRIHSMSFATTERSELIVEIILGILLCFMPLAYGAVEPWSELVLVVLSSMMILYLAFKGLSRWKLFNRWTWGYLCMTLIIFLVVLQIAPLPAYIIRILSPHTLELKNELLSDLPQASGALKWITLSFYPLATERSLRIVLAIVFIFVTVFSVYQSPESIKRLLLVITLIGGFIAILAILQNMFDNGKIYWIIPTGRKQANAGPFINPSNFCQFMNLSLGASLGLLLVKLHDIFGHNKITPAEFFEQVQTPAFKLIWLCVWVIFMEMACVFLSFSKGGMISLLTAVGFTVLMLAFRSNMKGSHWVITLLALLSFISVFYVGFNAVSEHLKNLQYLQNSSLGRWQIVKDISVEWMKFPLTGTGLGTHDVVYPMFDRATIPALAAHAENEYAQTAEETGIIGLLTILFFLGIIWRNYFRCLRGQIIDIQLGAVGLGFGLFAVMIHSLTDFGQHIPANAVLAVLSAALIINLAKLQSDKQPTKENSEKVAEASPFHFSYIFSVIFFFLLATCVWMVWGGYKDMVAASYWEKAYKMEKVLTHNNWLGSNKEYRQIIQDAQQACHWQPRDITYRYWLNVYRWHAVSRVIDSHSGDVLILPQTMNDIRRIVDDMSQARLLCPTFGPLYCVMGQLQAYILDNPKGLANIRRGYKLAPYDATASFLAGKLDIREGNLSASLVKFKRTLKLDRQFMPDVIKVYLQQAQRPDLAVRIAADSVDSLCYLGQALLEWQDIGNRQSIKHALQEVMLLLQIKCKSTKVNAKALANVANLLYRQQNYKLAAQYYYRALILDYSQMDWHLMRARCLERAQQPGEAIKEARIYLRYNPANKAVKKLLRRLSSQK